jgi:hypothetical protein
MKRIYDCYLSIKILNVLLVCSFQMSSVSCHSQALRIIGRGVIMYVFQSVFLLLQSNSCYCSYSTVFWFLTRVP